MFATILVVFFVVEGCASYQTGQQKGQAEGPNAPIEANILKLEQAQQKLSADPTDTAALSVILTLIKDPNGINRSNAAHTLGQVGEEHGSVIKDIAVPVLIEMVERGDGFDRRAALKALRGFGPHATTATPVLRKMLQSPDAQNSWLAAETLGRMRAAAAEAVSDLVSTVKTRKNECRDDELHICRFAIQALGNIGPAAMQATADLTALLNDGNPYLRAYAAVALLRIKSNSKEAVTALDNLLANRDDNVRRRTMWELRDAGKEASPVKSLVNSALRDKDESVRRAASELLETLRH
jgi:HEAT repeat protein